MEDYLTTKPDWGRSIIQLSDLGGNTDDMVCLILKTRHENMMSKCFRKEYFLCVVKQWCLCSVQLIYCIDKNLETIKANKVISP